MPGSEESSRRPGRPPGSEGAETRRRIVRSARAIFTSLGYDKATPALIAADAGITRTAIYSYYNSKADLYSAAFDSIRDDVLATMMEKSASTEPPLAARIGALLQTAVELHAHDHTIITFMTTSMVEGLRHPDFQDRVLAQVDGVRRFLAAELTEAQRRGELAADIDLHTATNTLLSTLWGLAWFAAFIGSATELDAAVEMLLRSVFGVHLCPPEPTETNN